MSTDELRREGPPPPRRAAEALALHLLSGDARLRRACGRAVRGYAGGGSAAQCVGSAARRVDAVQALLLQAHGAALRERAGGAAAEARAAARRQAEAAVYLPLRRRLLRDCGALLRAAEGRAAARMAALEAEAAAAPLFGVGAEVRGCAAWPAAVLAWRGVEAALLPCDAARAVCGCARRVAALWEESGGGAMGADDFLPLFAYVLVHARPRRALLLRALLPAMLDAEEAAGESGYNCATVQAALQMVLGEGGGRGRGAASEGAGGGGQGRGGRGRARAERNRS